MPRSPARRPHATLDRADSPAVDSGAKRPGPAFRMRPRRRVALLIETSNGYARNLLQGVMSYIREHAPWSFYLVEQGRGDDPPAWLARWDGDGIIARIESDRIAAAVVKSGLPAVDVSAGRRVPSLPGVETDDVAIAQLAASHLLERGFKNLGYCGDARFRWSLDRAAAFRAALAPTQTRLFEFESAQSGHEMASLATDLASWLKALPKPIGIFACYDIRGQQILDACRRIGLAVPEEVAVLGVDNDELLCDLAFPPLSSIIPNARRSGYEAAAMLDALMRGKRVPPVETKIAPLGIQLRQSTDILAVEDPHIAQAVRFIREHACDPIDVGDLLKVVPLSRRILEKRFGKLLNRSPHEEILNVRLNRVKQLLSDTELSLEEIAARAGFEHPEYLSVVFKREVGVSPRTFRQSLGR